MTIHEACAAKTTVPLTGPLRLRAPEKAENASFDNTFTPETAKTVVFFIRRDTLEDCYALYLGPRAVEVRALAALSDDSREALAALLK